MAPDKIYAPFTASEVEALNLYQVSGVFHPFTCARCGTNLKASREGWYCPNLDGYTQNWAHAFMANKEATLERMKLMGHKVVPEPYDESL